MDEKSHNESVKLADMGTDPMVQDNFTGPITPVPNGEAETQTVLTTVEKQGQTENVKKKKKP